MLEGAQKDGVYRAIFERRDIREFNSNLIPEEKLKNILLAGHHAPSVGFMQPWDFIVIESQEVKDPTRGGGHVRGVTLSLRQICFLSHVASRICG